MKEFNIDKHLDSQTNDYLNSMEMSREEIERLEIEIDNKLMALADELKDMLDDLNKEYKGLEDITIEQFKKDYL